jgi:hypothetical protein
MFQTRGQYTNKESFIKGLHKGKVKALVFISQSYFDNLSNYARLLVSSDEKAEEITHDAIRSLWTSRLKN